MTPRPRHSKKEVEEALRYAEGRGWTVEKRAGGHNWGAARCGHTPGGCLVWIHSTPKNAGNHAKRIRQAVDRCPHQAPRENEEGEGDG